GAVADALVVQPVLRAPEGGVPRRHGLGLLSAPPAAWRCRRVQRRRPARGDRTRRSRGAREALIALAGRAVTGGGTAVGLDGRPAPDDILIVAIDEPSLAALGRWPWRRTVHAALLNRLGQAGVRGVGLDVILSEPDTEHPQDDALLAEAMRGNVPVVLPLIM